MMVSTALKRTLGATALVAVVGFTLGAPRAAQADLSHGYPAASPITPGSIVALSPDGSGAVVPAGQTLIERAIGVVVSGSTLSLGGTTGEVQVATDGTATTLVSTANGDIKKGDYITISPIAAVGMKALASGRIIGVAQDDFSSATAGAESMTLKQASGTDKTIAVGQIPLAVGVTTYNIKSSAVTVSGVVQNFAQQIVGKPVGSARIYVALCIVLAALSSSVALLYAGVRTSIVAVGRNPLAKTSITRSLGKIIAMVLLILVVSAGSTWLVLR